MMPVLRHDQVVLAIARTDYKPGDVIIVRHGGLEKIKRISQLMADRLFVVGDNQEHSTDSRQFGWLPLSAVVGKVVWPAVYRAPGSDS